MSPGGSHDLVIFNNSGRLTPGKPFPLFGSPALLGARFILGSEALKAAPLSAVRLCLEWDTLPPDFDERYKVYGFRRKDFRMRLERIREGVDTAPDSADNLFPLFPAHGDRTVIELPPRARPYWGKPMKEPSANLSLADSHEGFLCLRLVAPDNGFGISDYPKLMTAAALGNASRLASGKASLPVALPPPPFLPMVRELELWLDGKRVGP